MGTVTWLKKTSYSRNIDECSPYDEQLLQLFYGATWDGDLISKALRSEAVENGHAMKAGRWNVWNIITYSGVEYLAEKGLIKP